MRIQRNLGGVDTVVDFWDEVVHNNSHNLN